MGTIGGRVNDISILARMSRGHEMKTSSGQNPNIVDPTPTLNSDDLQGSVRSSGGRTPMG